MNKFILLTTALTLTLSSASYAMKKEDSSLDDRRSHTTSHFVKSEGEEREGLDFGNHDKARPLNRVIESILNNSPLPLEYNGKKFRLCVWEFPINGIGSDEIAEAKVRALLEKDEPLYAYGFLAGFSKVYSKESPPVERVSFHTNIFDKEDNRIASLQVEGKLDE